MTKYMLKNKPALPRFDVEEIEEKLEKNLPHKKRK
jgi:hypothetical protein